MSNPHDTSSQHHGKLTVCLRAYSLRLLAFLLALLSSSCTADNREATRARDRYTATFDTAQYQGQVLQTGNPMEEAERVAAFESRFLVKASNHDAVVSPGGLVVMEGRIDGSFVGGVEYTLSIFDAYLPMAISAHLVSFDLDASRYEVVFTVDPEARRDETFSGKLIPRLIPATGVQKASVLDVSLTTKSGHPFDARTVADLYLATRARMNAARDSLKRSRSVLNAAMERLLDGGSSPVDAIQEDMAKAAAQSGRDTAVAQAYLDVLRRAALNPDAGIADAARRALCVLSERHEGEMTVSVLTRGIRGAARRRPLTQEVSKTILSKLLVSVAQCDAVLQGLPDDGILKGAVPVALAATMDKEKDELGKLFQEHRHAALEAVDALNALQTPGARVVLGYIADKDFVGTTSSR